MTANGKFEPAENNSFDSVISSQPIIELPIFPDAVPDLSDKASEATAADLLLESIIPLSMGSTPRPQVQLNYSEAPADHQRRRTCIFHKYRIGCYFCRWK